LRKDENVKLYAISVDPPDVSKTLAEKIASDGRGEINFSILSDKEHQTIDAYGLHDPAYDGREFDGIPKAAVYVIDKKGIVRWAKVENNYRERPTNEVIRAALDNLK
jgi:alkyl hydroperoxide reductase subunit AhpC